MTTESSIVKRLESSMDRKSRFNNSFTNIKDKAQPKIKFNHIQTDPDTALDIPTENDFNYHNHKPINEDTLVEEMSHEDGLSERDLNDLHLLRMGKYINYFEFVHCTEANDDNLMQSIEHQDAHMHSIDPFAEVHMHSPNYGNNSPN